MELSGLDVKALVIELNSVLNGYYISSIHHVTENSFIFRLRNSIGDEKRLIVCSKGAWITKRDLAKRGFVTPMLRVLRDKLLRLKLREVVQPNSERIIIFNFANHAEFKLVVELFGKGNVILSDRDDKIVALINKIRGKSRTLLPDIQYTLPKPRGIDPYNFTYNNLQGLKKSGQNLSKWLITNIAISKKYVNEILERAGVDGNRKGHELSKDDLDTIWYSLQEILEKINKAKGYIVFEKDSVLEVMPIKPKSFKEFKVKELSSFNEALDESLTNLIVKKKLGEELEKERAKVEELSKGIERLMQSIEKEKKRAIMLREIANMLFSFQFNEVIKYAKVVNLKLEKINDELCAKIGNEQYGLNYKDAPKLASKLFELAKESEKKVRAMENALHRLEAQRSKYEKGLEMIVKRKEEEVKRVVRRKEWFERYRWFKTSNGLLAIGGRDASSNDSIVRRYMEKNDLIFHADLHGSPFFILKTLGKGIEEIKQDIEEVGQAVVCFSSAWKSQFVSADAYFVKPEQIGLQAPPGMYLPKGSFMIYGKKEFLKGLRLELALGIVRLNKSYTITCGPVSAIKAHAIAYVKIVPFSIKVSEVAKNIMKEFLSSGFQDIMKNFTLDDIIRILPAGGAKIVGKEILKEKV
jgi:predicted ribosome quality control (RQC) complex YloA/Tae2 family protein